MATTKDKSAPLKRIIATLRPDQIDMLKKIQHSLELSDRSILIRQIVDEAIDRFKSGQK